MHTPRYGSDRVGHDAGEDDRFLKRERKEVILLQKDHHRYVKRFSLPVDCSPSVYSRPGRDLPTARSSGRIETVPRSSSSCNRPYRTGGRCLATGSGSAVNRPGKALRSVDQRAVAALPGSGPLPSGTAGCPCRKPAVQHQPTNDDDDDADTIRWA